MQYLFIECIIKNNYNLLVLFVFLVRNYTLLYFVENASKHKEPIAYRLCKEDYKYEFDMNVLSSSIIETFSYNIIHNYYVFNETSIYTDILYFIPISFIFEIYFDLFHYIGHRMLHNKYLYKYLHKKHHKFKHTIPIITFYQDPIDIIITNVFPMMLTLMLIPIPGISHFQYNAIIIYKTYGEICGHLSKKCYPTVSFCQFIWLPKALNIELHTEEHDFHHSLNNCNFSKRFSLWDKCFGTFTSVHHHFNHYDNPQLS
jgi:sterol desaturase/sphingolipid hydroxylase (fatty acid hydroxylase superfamily)